MGLESPTLLGLFGEFDFFAPLADKNLQPGKKYRYPSELTEGEMKEALACDEIIVADQYDGNPLARVFLELGRKPIISVWSSVDCNHERCNYRESSFSVFERIMDDSLKTKVLVLRNKDVSGMNPENVEIVNPE